MPKLGAVRWHELVRRFRKLGFDGPFARAKHPYLVRGNLVITIPNPHRKEIGVALLSRILKEAGISREESEEAR